MESAFCFDASVGNHLTLSKVIYKPLAWSLSQSSKASYSPTEADGLTDRTDLNRGSVFKVHLAWWSFPTHQQLLFFIVISYKNKAYQLPISITTSTTHIATNHQQYLCYAMLMMISPTWFYERNIRVSLMNFPLTSHFHWVFPPWIPWKTRKFRASTLSFSKSSSKSWRFQAAKVAIPIIDGSCEMTPSML